MSQGAMAWHNRIGYKRRVAVEDSIVSINDKPISNLVAKKYKRWTLIGGIVMNKKEIQSITDFCSFLLEHDD